MIMLGRTELNVVAAEALATAQECLTDSTPTLRETAYVQALDDWLRGHPRLAAAQMSALLDRHPEDALTVKIDHAIRFILGDAAGMRRMIEQVLPAYAPSVERGYLLGCHSFALEETGNYVAAEKAGRAALEVCHDDAWGLHAVAHVHDMTGRSLDGIAWLTGREDAWAHCNNFRYHVWWHKALMHLDQGQTDVVLDLYDTEIRQDKTDDYRDISNATSLLSRLELEGVDVGQRWEELAEISATRTEDGCLIFADLHYLLALIGGDREAETRKLVARIRADGARAETDIAQRMARPGISAAEGLEAFGEGNYAAAFVHLKAARPAMPLAGGSHAQRDVFERLTIDAGLRAGFHKEANALLKDRLARRGGCEDGYAAARFALIEEAAKGPSEIAT